MKFTSPYRNLSFKAKTSEVMFIACIAIGAVPFLIYALVNYYFIKNGHISRHRLTAFIEGIRGFDVLGIIITTCISAALILLVRRMMNRMQNRVKLIVEIDFPEDQKFITFTTKNASDKVCTSTVKLEQLNYSELNKQMDGIGHGEFNCIQLNDGERFVGRIYQEHYAWDSTSFDAIEAKIKSLAKKRHVISHYVEFEEDKKRV
jgi:hypothetical protein